MSNVSVLSREYKTASELSQTIDDALLILKQAQEAQRPREAPEGEKTTAMGATGTRERSAARKGTGTSGSATWAISSSHRARRTGAAEMKTPGKNSHGTSNGGPGDTIDSYGDFATILRDLASVLDELVDMLRPSDGEGSASLGAPSLRVPIALAVQLRAERRGDLDYYLDDLAELASHLKEGPWSLTSGDLNILDHLASMADAHTTSLFRQLMRR